MNITIKNIEGECHILNVTRDMTIRQLKEKYANVLGFSFFDCIFQFCGMVLQDDKTLDYYEIEDGDVIISNSKLMNIIIKDLKGYIHCLNVAGNTTIRQLKEKYAKAGGLSFSDSLFKWEGMILKDNKTLNFYGIEDGDIIISSSNVRAGCSIFAKMAVGKN